MQGIIRGMENKFTSNPLSTAVNDESVLTDEELKRIATVFDVLIDVDYYLNYTKVAVS